MEAVEHRRKMQLREQQMRMRRIAKERVGKHNLFREHMVVEHENHELHEKHLHRAVKGPTVETRFKIASRERMHKQEVGLTILHLQQKGKGKANGGKGMAKERFKKKRARRAVEKARKFMLHEEFGTKKKTRQQAQLNHAEESIAREARHGIATAMHKKKRKAHEHAMKELRKSIWRQKRRSMRRMRRLRRKLHQEKRHKAFAKLERREREHRRLKKMAHKSIASALFAAPASAKGKKHEGFFGTAATGKDLDRELHKMFKSRRSKGKADFFPASASKSGEEDRGSYIKHLAKHSKTADHKVAHKPSPKPKAKATPAPAAKTPAHSKPKPDKKTEVTTSEAANSLANQLKPYLPLWLFLGFTCLACILGAVVYKCREYGKVHYYSSSGYGGHWTNNAPDL